MKDNFLMVLLNAAMVFGAGVIYILPLRKREKWTNWLPVIFVLCLLCIGLSVQVSGLWAVASLLQYLCLVLMVNRCTKLSLSGACYCAIWSCITSEAAYELWLGFRFFTPDLHTTEMAEGLTLLIFASVCYLIIYRTLARWMPQGDIYQIGPRQLTSAFLLGGMFITLAHQLVTNQSRDYGQSVVFGMCQIYCISLLYLQTELFKKSQMQKDLEALNFLYSCEQQQYAVARQNVSAVNRKCKELEQMIEQMQQYLPEEARQETKESIADAMRACDTMVSTGNHVLDIVLTEKKLLAEAGSIQINCVADGKLLNFMEVVDIYAVFSNALDNAIEAVEGLSDKSHRLIDVLVHESQNFLVINISNPLNESLEFEEDLPVTTKTKNSFHGYGLKVLRRAIEKYHGMLSIEAADGFFTLKVLIPLSQKPK